MILCAMTKSINFFIWYRFAINHGHTCANYYSYFLIFKSNLTHMWPGTWCLIGQTIDVNLSTRLIDGISTTVRIIIDVFTDGRKSKNWSWRHFNRWKSWLTIISVCGLLVISGLLKTSWWQCCWLVLIGWWRLTTTTTSIWRRGCRVSFVK